MPREFDCKNKTHLKFLCLLVTQEFVTWNKIEYSRITMVLITIELNLGVFSWPESFERKILRILVVSIMKDCVNFDHE